MKTNVKNFRLITLMAILLFILKSEDKVFSQQYFEYANEVSIPSVYLGLGLGVNDYGMGILVEVPLSNKISINGNAGIGGWGWKIGSSLNFYPQGILNKSELSIGYSRTSGLQGFDTELWIEPDETEKVVKLDLNIIGTINLTYTYNLKIGNSFKTGFSLGYAIPLTKTPYEVKTAGVVLSSTSEQLLNIMQPGGIIVGIRFMFGI